MGLSTAWDKASKGEWHAAASALLVPEETIQEGYEIERRQRAFNEQWYALGRQTQEEFNAYAQAYGHNTIDDQLTAEDSPANEFAKGAGEGLASIASNVTLSSKNAEDFLLGIIPWKIVGVIVIGAILWVLWKKAK